jgi:hypothetical protein
MRVAFHKGNGPRSCTWEATLGKRRRVPGTVMGVGNDIPHDLAQYVIEAATRYEYGFWGCVARGATFKSTGRKRTHPGRAVIAEHRNDIIASEHLAGRHMFLWKCGEKTDVTRALDRALRQWRNLGPAQQLVYEWPSTAGSVE